MRKLILLCANNSSAYNPKSGELPVILRESLHHQHKLCNEVIKIKNVCI